MTTTDRIRDALLAVMEDKRSEAAEDRVAAARALMDLEAITPRPDPHDHDVAGEQHTTPEPIELVTAKFTHEQMGCLSHWVTMMVSYHNLMRDRANGAMPYRDLEPSRHALQAAGDRVRAAFGVGDES